MRNEGYFSRPFGRTYDTQAEKDILDGKISISQIPFEYRYSTPYRYAFRRFRGLKQIGQDDAAERKVFKKCLLDDIMECKKRKEKGGNLPQCYPMWDLDERRRVLEDIYRNTIKMQEYYLFWGVGRWQKDWIRIYQWPSVLFVCIYKIT